MKVKLTEETLNRYIEEAIRQELLEGNNGGILKWVGKNLIGKPVKRLWKNAKGEGTTKQLKTPQKTLDGAREAEAKRNRYKTSPDGREPYAAENLIDQNTISKSTAKKAGPMGSSDIDQAIEKWKQQKCNNEELLKTVDEWDNERQETIKNQLEYINAQLGNLEKMKHNLRAKQIASGVGLAAGGTGLGYGAVKAANGLVNLLPGNRTSSNAQNNNGTEGFNTSTNDGGSTWGSEKN